MTIRRDIIVLILFLISTFGIQAKPANPRPFILTQPDGSSFVARLTGDEFAHVLMTEDGAAIVRDEDGWYCYAFFENDATLHSSGYHVGAYTPGMITAAARQLPIEALREKAARVRSQRWSGIEAPVALPATKAPVKRKGLILLVQFPDLKFKFTKDDFEQQINGTGPYSARQYFNDQFLGRYEFEFDTSDILTLSKGFAYYGKDDSNGNDSHPDEMAAEACKLAVATGIDMSQYAQINPDEVDNVFIIYAGPDQADGASSDHIWAHAWQIYCETLVLNGKRIRKYACASELQYTTNFPINGIGTFCHEFSHILGTTDLYDVDYESSGGQSNAMWHVTSLMDGGNFNNDTNTPPYYNAIERQMLGIAHEMPLTLGSHTLRPVHIAGDCYRVDTETEGEYFLFECRSNEKWDAYIEGSGLLIYHIDKSTGRTISEAASKTPQKLWSDFQINICPSHECADLVEATPGLRCFNDKGQLNGYPTQRIFYPTTQNNSFTPLTKPAFESWDGTPMPYSIIGIKSLADGSVSFTVVSDAAIPDVTDLETVLFQDAAILNWGASQSDFSGDALVAWGPSGGQMKTITVRAGQDGRYGLLLEGLEPSSPYTVDIRFLIGEAEGTAVQTSFITKRYNAPATPYIWLPTEGRNSDGTFPSGTKLPLRVYNVPDATHVSWTFQGRPIIPDVDCWWTIPSSGELQALVTYPDRTQEIISKTLTIK